MAGLFESARTVKAWEAASKAGLPLKKHGARYFTACPMHKDKTPSLLLDERGRWHCFSCGAGGDAVALYQALYRLPPCDAAKRLCADFHLAVDGANRSRPPPPALRPPTAWEMKKAAEAYREREAEKLLKVKFAAREALFLEAANAPSRDACWENPAFIRALAALDACNTALHNLDSMAPEQLVSAMESTDEGGKTFWDTKMTSRHTKN